MFPQRNKGIKYKRLDGNEPNVNKRGNPEKSPRCGKKRLPCRGQGIQPPKDLPKYEIVYRENYKGEIVIKNIDLPRNRKTKLLIEKYAKHKLV